MTLTLNIKPVVDLVTTD